jgi:epoxide hydrolase
VPGLDGTFGDVTIALEGRSTMDGTDRSQEQIRPFRVKVPHSRLGDLRVPPARTRRFDHGGHFAAHKAPDLLAEDIRAFFGQLR